MDSSTLSAATFRVEKPPVISVGGEKIDFAKAKKDVTLKDGTQLKEVVSKKGVIFQLRENAGNEGKPPTYEVTIRAGEGKTLADFDLQAFPGVTLTAFERAGGADDQTHDRTQFHHSGKEGFVFKEQRGTNVHDVIREQLKEGAFEALGGASIKRTLQKALGPDSDLKLDDDQFKTLSIFRRHASIQNYAAKLLIQDLNKSEVFEALQDLERPLEALRKLADKHKDNYEKLLEWQFKGRLSLYQLRELMAREAFADKEFMESLSENAENPSKFEELVNAQLKKVKLPMIYIEPENETITTEKSRQTIEISTSTPEQETLIEILDSLKPKLTKEAYESVEKKLNANQLQDARQELDGLKKISAKLDEIDQKIDKLIAGEKFEPTPIGNGSMEKKPLVEKLDYLKKSLKRLQINVALTKNPENLKYLEKVENILNMSRDEMQQQLPIRLNS